METQMYKMDGRKVLVLDAAFQPINIVTWQDAFTILFGGAPNSKKAFRPPQVIAYSKDGAVIGVKRDIRVPSIIQLGDVVPHWRRRVRFCRKSVFARDEFTCQYCGKSFMTEDLTLDHVLPRAQGGTTIWTNVVTSCVIDNQRKANRTPEQAGMTLLRKPKMPNKVMQVTVKADLRHMPDEWADYWDVLLEK